MATEYARIKLSKGFQFTLPAISRKRHDLKPGQEIEVIDLEDKIILRPKKKGSLKNLIGIFRDRQGFDVVKEHDEIIASG